METKEQSNSLNEKFDNEKDITLICIECSKEFVFDVSNQNFFRDKGFINPKRCSICRQLKKQRYDNYTK